MEISKKKKPRKPCLTRLFTILFVCLTAGKVHALPYTANDLMSLCGFNGPCADTLVNGSATIANDTWLKWNDSASVSTNILKLDANDETVLNSSSGDGVHLQIGSDAQRLINYTAASDTALVLSFGDGTASQVLSILGSTADGADTQLIQLSPGNSTTMSNSRGPYAILEGNESGGRLTLGGGGVATGHVLIVNGHSSSSIKFQNASSGDMASFNNSGDLSFDATNGGNIVFNKGGSYVTMASYVPTMAATPVLGTNLVSPGLNVVPTAAANTAAWLGASTPVPGQQFKIFNNSGAVVRIKGAGAATINGAAAGLYIGMAAASYMECTTVSTGVQICPYYSVNGAVAAAPTPAGP